MIAIVAAVLLAACLAMVWLAQRVGGLELTMKRNDKLFALGNDTIPTHVLTIMMDSKDRRLMISTRTLDGARIGEYLNKMTEPYFVIKGKVYKTEHIIQRTDTDQIHIELDAILEPSGLKGAVEVALIDSAHI